MKDTCGHQRVLDGAGAEARGQIGLADRDGVAAVARVAARAARLVGAGVGAGRAVGRVDAAVQAPGALGRVDDDELIDLLVARQAAQGGVGAEVVLEHAGQCIDVDLLDVHVAVAEIALAVHARQQAAIGGEIGQAVLRHVLVVLVQVAEGEAGVRTQADGERRCEAPALVALDVAIRHVVAVGHRVQAQRLAVVEVDVVVGGGAGVVGGLRRPA